MKRVWVILLFIFLPACSSVTTTNVSPTLHNSPAPETASLPSPTAAITIEPTINQPATTSTLLVSPTSTLAPASTATALPDPNGYVWQQIASGLAFPIGMTNAGDGSGRLFLLEKAGAIRILQNGQILPSPFLDIGDQVTSRGSEQGLLGLAFHPHYAENGFFYVNYIDRQGNTVIARFQVRSDDPDHADPTSEKQLLTVQQPFPNHNGGQLAFGPDGYLYAGLGDGGSAGDPLDAGQSLNTLLGKILRLDVDHGNPYAIPSDNPFASGGGKPEIWAYGLRNPWRFSFDQLTGDLYIGDVGQNIWEEIDFPSSGSKGGENFGWSYFEGLHPYKGVPSADVNFTPPVAEYSHDQGCAVIGGYVYRSSELPEWQGVYLFGDYCSGNIWGLRHDNQGNWKQDLLFESGMNITTFGQDQDGKVYLADQAGEVYVLAKK
jgi:glucose/arabinose dehydrogenase